MSTRTTAKSSAHEQKGYLAEPKAAETVAPEPVQASGPGTYEYGHKHGHKHANMPPPIDPDPPKV